MAKGRPRKKEATEVMEKDNVVSMEIPEMTEEEVRAAQAAAYQDFLKERELARKTCGEEINVILEKYGCEMTAQLLINEHKTIPQVFIIDSRSRKNAND